MQCSPSHALDFLIAEEIIFKAEKLKAKAASQVGAKSKIALSDIIEGYKKVMKKYGINTTNENHYYAMMVKLSLN